ncbi:unnamed protein product, partial [Amoebophrya sp. A25]
FGGADSEDRFVSMYRDEFGSASSPHRGSELKRMAPWMPAKERKAFLREQDGVDLHKALYGTAGRDGESDGPYRRSQSLPYSTRELRRHYGASGFLGKVREEELERDTIDKGTAQSYDVSAVDNLTRKDLTETASAAVATSLRQKHMGGATRLGLITSRHRVGEQARSDDIM